MRKIVMAKEVRLYAGTRKGGFVFRSTDGRRTWTQDAPVLAGWSLNHLIEDPRDPDRVYAAANHEVWGPWLARSLDGGRSFGEHTDSPKFAPDGQTSVKALWHVRPGHAERPGEVWAGVDPGSLFRSDDWGATWSAVPGINEHPTREGWQPGGGGLCLHKVVLDPANPSDLIATISAAGAFRSEDGGATWRPINQGIRAEFLPDPTVPVGHCVHHLLRSPVHPEWLFQQNHCGVYRSRDGGALWQEITEGLPSGFGFAAAIHPHDAQTIYLAPLIGDSFRVFPDGAMTVWRSRDGGDSWDALRNGLPQGGAYLSSLRGAMTVDREESAGVYAGTTNGHIFYSPDEGEHWSLLAEYLPPVLSLEVAS
jgi:photosystem II stability/assembly factor-like uncharacterized protein